MSTLNALSGQSLYSDREGKKKNLRHTLYIVNPLNYTI